MWIRTVDQRYPTCLAIDNSKTEARVEGPVFVNIVGLEIGVSSDQYWHGTEGSKWQRLVPSVRQKFTDSADLAVSVIIRGGPPSFRWSVNNRAGQ